MDIIEFAFVTRTAGLAGFLVMVVLLEAHAILRGRRPDDNQI